jgi:hypothetical protein
VTEAYSSLNWTRAYKMMMAIQYLQDDLIYVAVIPDTHAHTHTHTLYKYVCVCARPCMCTKKIKLSLCLIKHHAMKTDAGVKVHLHALSTALDGGEWSTSCNGCFTPMKQALVPTVEEAGWAPEPAWML